jgi:putative membrane protein
MFHDNWNYMGHMGFHQGGFMFWVIAILVVFLLVKIFKDNKKVHKNSEDESLQILKNRFARGDITGEEYSSKKSILNL